eukprot:1664655-Prymnesium_polylepis.1
MAAVCEGGWMAAVCEGGWMAAVVREGWMAAVDRHKWKEASKSPREEGVTLYPRLRRAHAQCAAHLARLEHLL